MPKTTPYKVELDLDGHKTTVELQWGQPLPPIVYNNKTGIFYQLLRGYSYCQIAGKVLSNIEVVDDAKN